MASQGATFFFDRDADFVTGYTSTIRTEFVFGAIADGTFGKLAASDKLFKDFVRGVVTVVLSMQYTHRLHNRMGVKMAANCCTTWACMHLTA
jgi:hypothetical protein